MRSFSSSNDSRNDSNNAAPKFERGLSGLGAVFSRVSDRSSEFQRYQKAGVFPPDDSWLTNMIAFVALNIPQRTQIDAVEFIEGAKHACKAQLTAVNSLEFGKYIGGEISQCDNAHLLQKYCTPAFYQSASSNVKLTYAMRNLIFESQGAAIEGIHLKSVEYARLTDQEYKDEVTGLRQAPFLVWSEDASVERMKLALHVTTVENVKMNYFKRKEDTSKFVQQQNAYTWIFESRVTRPEDVDWRIADVYRVSGRVLDLPPEEQAKKAST